MNAVVKPNRVGGFPYAATNPETRKKDFSEVKLPYTPEQAMSEADRCLRCGTAVCIDACPLYMNVRGMNEAVARGDFKTAFHRIRETNPLLGTTARVCPQLSKTCEEACAMQWGGQPVAVGMIQRFLADWERKECRQPDPACEPKTGKHVSIVGAGPAGIAAAELLERYGHSVTIYEELPFPGGTPRYGIPAYRLPKDVLNYEIDRVKGMGVEIRTGVKVGEDIKLTDMLSEGSDAVLLTTGPKDVMMLEVPGVELEGIFDCYEFLEEVYLRGPENYLKNPVFDLGNRIIVIGGGDSAVDAARTALRLTGGKVTIAYRRTEEEMPAQKDQIEEAKEEGVEFKLLASPIAFRGRAGRVAFARMQVMKLGPPDESGRRRPEPTGEEFELGCTSVIQAVGRGPNTYLQKLYGMQTGKEDTISVDEHFQTSIPGVFAGGDVTTGETTVGMAMANGRKAAQYVHEYLMKLEDKHVSLYDMYYTERTKPLHYWDMLLGKEEKFPPP